jgi:LysM repeat protein
LNRNPNWTKCIIVLFAAGLLLPSVLTAIDHQGTRQLSGGSAAAYSIDPIATGNPQFDQYDSIIVAQAQAHGLDPFVVKGQILFESWFNPNAISPWGDLGLMQLKAGTFQSLGYTGSWSGMFDPATNIYYGTMNLQRLVWQFGNLPLALQAYNIGSWAVENGHRNWAYSNQVFAYAQMFRNQHVALYGSAEQAQGSNSNGLSNTSPSSNSNASNSSISGATYYTVKSGDYLFKISQIYGVSWQQIAQKNGIQSPYLIFPGEKLQIQSSSYRVVSGDFLYSIAERYGVAWQSIAQANNLNPPYLVFPGEQLTIP